MTEQLEGASGTVLAITAGEETGCEAAFHLARADILGRAGDIFVAEPTSNATLGDDRSVRQLDVMGPARSARGWRWIIRSASPVW